MLSWQKSGPGFNSGRTYVFMGFVGKIIEVHLLKGALDDDDLFIRTAMFFKKIEIA